MCWRTSLLAVVPLVVGCSNLDPNAVLPHRRDFVTPEDVRVSNELAKLGRARWLPAARFYSPVNYAQFSSYREPPERLEPEATVLHSGHLAIDLGRGHRPDELYEVVRRFHWLRAPRRALSADAEQRVSCDALALDYVHAMERAVWVRGPGRDWGRRAAFGVLYDRYSSRLVDSLRLGSPADFHRRATPFLRFCGDEAALLDSDDGGFGGRKWEIWAALALLTSVAPNELETALLTRWSKAQQETVLLGLVAAQTTRARDPDVTDYGQVAEGFAQVCRIGFDARHRRAADDTAIVAAWPATD